MLHGVLASDPSEVFRLSLSPIEKWEKLCMDKAVTLHDGKEPGSNEISGFGPISLNKPEPETCFLFSKEMKI